MQIDVLDLEKDIAVLQAGIKSSMDLVERLTIQETDIAVYQLAALETELEGVRAAQALLTALSTRSREDLCRHLSTIVTAALRHVYGQALTFVVELSTDKNGSARLDYYVQTAEGLKVKPQDAMGGGVVDTIAIALRIAILALMNNPPLPGPVILDEPGRHLDPESAARLGEFLKYISDTTGRQFIVVTHHDSITPYADKAYMVNQAGLRSVVSDITIREE